MKSPICSNIDSRFFNLPQKLSNLPNMYLEYVFFKDQFVTYAVKGKEKHVSELYF